jgi:hypothetical protein
MNHWKPSGPDRSMEPMYHLSSGLSFLSPVLEVSQAIPRQSGGHATGLARRSRSSATDRRYVGAVRCAAQEPKAEKAINADLGTAARHRPNPRKDYDQSVGYFANRVKYFVRCMGCKQEIAVVVEDSEDGDLESNLPHFVGVSALS